MKIYIVGITGCGKTTLGKKLSETLKIPYYELDKIVYNHNEKNSIDFINDKFQSIIKSDNWIIEDVLRDYFKIGLESANTIIFMDINIYTRNYRLLKRFIKQKLSLEERNYNCNLAMLKQLLRWSYEYERDKINRVKLLDGYYEKVIIVKNNKDIKTLIKKLTQN